MPYIKRLKKGRFPGFDGDKAFELIEVDDAGNPVIRNIDPLVNTQVLRNNKPSRTEKKIAPGLRAPDVVKGYDKPFDYHLWNKLRAEGKLKKR